jgi:ubiquinone/menaquinone biosynthesis C-methylase UbiE
MLTTAQQNLSHSQCPFKFEIVDAQTIPFDDKSFDIVIANHMLYHVPDKPKALSQIRRILKPGGRFYAATNSQVHLKELRELIENFDPDIGASEQPFSISFGLENGQDQISAWFASVTLRRYEDALIVTEAAPLIDYILSSSKAEAISHQREAFTGFIEQRLALQGSIYITKDAGLFEAF